MATASLEHRIAAVARGLAIRLNEPQPGDLARLARAGEIHPLTRRRVERISEFRQALAAGHRPDELELALIETAVDGLEDLLGLQPLPQATPALERATA